LLLIAAALALAPAAPAQIESDSPRLRDRYTIGVDDVLRLFVWDEDAFDMRLKVRPDGYVSAPLVGEVRAAGLTPVELQETIAERLTEFIRSPIVSIIVEEINSFKVYVLGEINSPGVYSFSSPPRLLQLIAAAGGTTAFAKRAVIVNEDDPVGEGHELELKPMLAGRSFRGNIQMTAGDVVVIE
jgi:polysaccharide export outer membrane protein